MQNDPNSLQLPTSAPSLPKRTSTPHDLQRQRHLRPQQQLVQVVHATVPRVAALAGPSAEEAVAAEEFRGGVALQQAPEGILCGDGWP